VNCAEVERGDYIARYLAGRLDEREKQELEEHWFSCDHCYGSVKDVFALRSELAEARDPAHQSPQPAARRRGWIWALAAAAIATIGLLWVSPSRQPSHEILQLSAIEAPPYVPKTLRSGADQAERLFREAMTHYQAASYVDAIPGLAAAAAANPESARACFYLGVCQFLTEQPQAAIDSFTRVVDLGATPYHERSRHYRAKALLRTGDIEAAKVELEQVVLLAGEMEDEARRILDRLTR
jgi:tetratricopeptide (TPR) repeat protein